MAHPSILRTLRAQGEAEALEVLEELLPEESELLYRARHDVSREPEFTDAAMTIELVRVVAAQQKRIEALEAKGKSGKSRTTKKKQSA